MRSLNGPVRIGAAALLLVAMTLAAPSTTSAACGGGRLDEDWLARYAGRHADTIILGRLIEVDAEALYAHHFELLQVYRGEAIASPIENTFEPGVSIGINDVGGCTGQQVEPGQRFVYAEGDRKRHGPMQMIFPEVLEGRWIIQHFGARATLDELLVLLAVLPATSTVDAAPDARIDPVWWATVLGGSTLLAYWVLAKRRAI